MLKEISLLEWGAILFAILYALIIGRVLYAFWLALHAPLVSP